MSAGNYPSKITGRRACNLTTFDWQQLAAAYDIWNEHMEVTDVPDPDLRDYVKDIFYACDMWDEAKNEPDIAKYHALFMHNC